VRQGEHDMEIAGVEEFAFACHQPPLAGLRLTLGAVPISTRNGELTITCIMGSFF